MIHAAITLAAADAGAARETRSADTRWLRGRTCTRASPMSRFPANLSVAARPEGWLLNEVGKGENDRPSKRSQTAAA